MNYRTLHLIYNPWLEVLLGILCLAYSILILKIEQWVVYIYLIIPWLMYFTIRKLRYQVRPYLKDNYKYLFAFNIFSFLFFFGYFFVSLMIRMQAEGGVSATNQILPRLWLSLGFIISATLFARIGVYLASYKRFNAEISGKIYEIRNPRARKLVFFVASMLLLVSLTGIGLLTDILKRERIQVGRVLEKYVIDPDNGQPDTLAVISGMSPSGFQVVTDILQDHADGNLKLTCRIEECQSKDIRSYEICCSQTFDRIPMGTLVKFGYSPEFTITRLIED